MRFTRLRLNGFKSFVDPTDLVISDGLTGVVGPNGCGKSNLLEALRWVMGENRPTAMRGGGMEDVIFAGAATRAARNFAEVALILDNSERLAPAGFNDTDTLEIVRRITRDAGSAYKVGHKEVRARDVQMLFADASTGSHSPALVRQGQIAELINARPTSRRMILEEAAGISGLYQRRHEAELKLKGAEANLLRVDDVIEALAQQITALARQARAAARYREIGVALRRTEGMLLYRRWHEADAANRAAATLLRDSVVQAARAETAALQAGKGREAAETALPPRREDATIAAAVLQRLELESERLITAAQGASQDITTLQDQLAQMDRDTDRETALNRDAGEMIARLGWESAEITRAALGHDQRLDAASAAARDAAATLLAREADLGRQTEDVARLAARHQSAQRLLEDGRKTRDRAEAEAQLAHAARQDAIAALARAEIDVDAADLAEQSAVATALHADETLAAAEAARSETQVREAEARVARAGAEGEANALRAEVAALTRLVSRDTAEGGQVMDLLTVRPGYERALGAALADDLRVPVVTAIDKSGWVALNDFARPQPLPDGVTALTGFVTMPPVLQRRLSQVGLVDAAAGAGLQSALLPGQRLVSVEGDLWRWDGLRAAAEDAPSAAALRLQQLNRMVELKRDLEEVAARALGAAQAHAYLTTRLAALTLADQTARQARRDADRLVTDANRAASRAEAGRSIAMGRRDAAGLALDRLNDEASAGHMAVAEAEAGLAGLADLATARHATEAVKSAVGADRASMLSRRSALDDIRREGETRARRLVEVTRDIATWTARLETAEKRTSDLASRRAAALSDLTVARSAPATIAARQAALATARVDADRRRQAADDNLALAEATLQQARLAEREADRLASDAREGRARAEARADAARDLQSAAAARIAEVADQSVAELLAEIAVDLDAMPPADQIETQVQALRRQRDALGAVNLRAEEDAMSVQAEHDSLIREKTDLEDAVRALRTGIAALNREGRERLLTAFEQVNDNFALLFTHLFGGGEAKLMLVESDDPLDAGLEIMCQPPGKKLAVLSLLSGGEQTLTAMALIFAVFLANPAPICVLDEVDAPLDDANVARFCDLLDEMTRRTETRFLVITHHAVTMSRMDRLFGVTMGEQGVSQLVSVDLKKAAALVA